MLKSLESFKETNYTKILSKKELNNLESNANPMKKENKESQEKQEILNNNNNESAVFDQVSKKNRKFKLLGHTDSIFSISISPDKKFIISGSFDETIRLWSIYTKSTLVIYTGHFAPVLSVKFSPFS